MFGFKKINKKILKKNQNWIIFHLILTSVLLIVFLLEFKIVGQSVYGDSRYYMAFTRSIYFSQNVDITDEMAHYWSPQNNNLPAGFDPVPELKNAIKITTHNFSLGISVIWLPIYLIADFLVIIFSRFDSGIVRNGYSDIYQLVLGVGNISFVVGGLIFLSNILTKFYSKFISALSIILILFSTNLFYYSSIDAVNTHPFSFFGTSVLLFLLFKYKENKKLKYLFVQGLVLGLLTANRMQDGILILVPLLTFLSGIKMKKIKKEKEIIKIFIIGLGGAIGYLPQLILLFLGQNRILLIPHLAKAESDFMPFRHILNILFDQKLGVFFYMPILFASVFGLFLFRKNNKTLGTVFLTIFILVFILISSYDGWNVAGYTARYFISIFPILVFGLAQCISVIKKRYSNLFLYLVIGIFILHQGLSVISFKLFWQDPTFVGTELSNSGQLKIQIIEILSKYYPLQLL